MSLKEPTRMVAKKVQPQTALRQSSLGSPGLSCSRKIPKMLHQAKEVLPKNVASKPSPRIQQSSLARISGDNLALGLRVAKEISHWCIQRLGDSLQPV